MRQEGSCGPASSDFQTPDRGTVEITSCRSWICIMARLGCKVDTVYASRYTLWRECLYRIWRLGLCVRLRFSDQTGGLHVITRLSLEPRLSCAISLRIYQQFTQAKWLITGSYVTFSYDFPILLTRGTPRNALSVIQRKHYARFYTARRRSTVGLCRQV